MKITSKLNEMQGIVQALNHFGSGPKESVAWRFGDNAGKVRYNISRSIGWAQKELESIEESRQKIIAVHLKEQEAEGGDSTSLEGEAKNKFIKEWGEALKAESTYEARPVQLSMLDLNNNAFNCVYLSVLLDSGHIIDDTDFDDEKASKEDDKPEKKPKLSVVGEKKDSSKDDDDDDD